MDADLKFAGQTYETLSIGDKVWTGDPEWPSFATVVGKDEETRGVKIEWTGGGMAVKGSRILMLPGFLSKVPAP